jgi:hypothetical protein
LPTVRVKLHDWDEASQQVEKSLKAALAKPVPAYAIKYLRWLLQHNQQATGERMPKKAASTIKAYKRKGYDTVHYLIASGESTKLAFHIENNGALVVIEPRRQDILGYHTPDDPKHGKVIWIELDEKAEQDIMEILETAVAKALH